MKKMEHVKIIEEAMSWLNEWNYRVWEEISKKTEPTTYRHDSERLGLTEEYAYIIIASDNVLELATDSADDVIRFVNEMIECFNELN